MSAYAKTHPDLALPRYWLGSIAMDRDDSQSARTHFKAVIEIAPKFWPALDRLGYLETAEGNAHESVSIYKRLRELRPESADALFRLGFSEILTFHNEDSAVHLLEAIEKNPAHMGVSLMAMFPLQYLDDLESAEKVLESAARTRPDSALLQMFIARNKQLMGKYEESETAYLKVMEMDPSYSKPPMELANRIYVPEGRIEDAVKMYRLAIELEPSRNSNRIDLGLILLSIKRREEARALFDEVLRRKPGDYNAYLGIAEIEIAEGEWEKASENLSRVLKLEPNHEQALILLMIVNNRLGKKNEAGSGQ